MKIVFVQRAVGKCPVINISVLDINIPCLLDTGIYGVNNYGKFLSEIY